MIYNDFTLQFDLNVVNFTNSILLHGVSKKGFTLEKKQITTSHPLFPFPKHSSHQISPECPISGVAKF